MNSAVLLEYHDAGAIPGAAERCLEKRREEKRCVEKRVTDDARLQDYAEPRRRRVDDALQQFLDGQGRGPARLHEAMQYAALGSGKRMRPLLCIAAAELCGGSIEDVLPTACALELIHAFSLIHDDLPAMDGDDLRRGRPTCHVKYGEAIAILAGDALLAAAFGLIAVQGRTAGCQKAMAVLTLLSQATSTDGMAGGQAEDILSEGAQRGSLETLEFIHTRKTGALVSASVVAGATLAGAPPSAIQAMKAYGSAVGHAFQIADDVLGEVGDAAMTGKPVKRDRELEKLTYPRLFGIARSRELAAQKAREAVAAISGFSHRSGPLDWIAGYAVARSR
jgi:geranylgeranyl diphosphate synthase type II